MPFARIEVDATRTAAEVKAISDGVYGALIEAVHAPRDDKFHVVTKRETGTLIFSKDYLSAAQRALLDWLARESKHVRPARKIVKQAGRGPSGCVD
jgi:hypothetical protein